MNQARLAVVGTQYVKVALAALVAVGTLAWIFYEWGAPLHRAVAIGGFCVGILLLAVGAGAEPDAYGSNRRRPRRAQGFTPRTLCLTTAPMLIVGGILLDRLR